MASLAHHFLSMAYNNTWANQRLLHACGQLSQNDFVAPRTSFFPSLKATLNHNLTVDWYYVDALERCLRGQPANAEARGYFDPEEPFAACRELHTAQRAVDHRLIELCKALTDAQLELSVAIQRSKGVRHETVTRLLAHLFQHQIHHRGQVHAMLAGTHVPPPPLDEFFCEQDAQKFALPELAAMGYADTTLWSAAVRT
ncbi:MAG: DinB family protein [Betaproteobacteria bacterium]